MAQGRLDLKPRQRTGVSTLFYLSGGRSSEEKRRGAFLFKASHVFDVKFNSSHDDFCFFEARVKASMTRNKVYRTKVRQNRMGEVMSVCSMHL